MKVKPAWWSVYILGFLGSLAWGVENQYFNTFIYNEITPDPRPISWMVAASAITATLASIFIGALSDRMRYKWGRKPFLLIGYVLWGVTTAVFPISASCFINWGCHCTGNCIRLRYDIFRLFRQRFCFPCLCSRYHDC